MGPMFVRACTAPLLEGAFFFCALRSILKCGDKTIVPDIGNTRREHGSSQRQWEETWGHKLIGLFCIFGGPPCQHHQVQCMCGVMPPAVTKVQKLNTQGQD